MTHANLPGQVAMTAAHGRWVLVVCTIASGMAFIDATALNVAMPALQDDLGASGAELLWIINAYGIPLAALLLPGGAAGDRFGRKAALMTGMGLFAAASIACGLAPGAAALIAARTVQGIGGAVMIPGSLALLAASVAAERRGRAIGAWTACSVAMTALGPAVGGVLAGAGLWRCVFFINGPLAVVAMLVLHLRVREPARLAACGRMDLAGGLAGLAGLAGVNFGLLSAVANGFDDPIAIGSLAAGIAALALFVVVEARCKAPLVPLALFRNRTFTAACLLTLSFYSGLYGMTYFLSLNLIQVQGYSEPAAGLALLPLVLMVVVVSLVMGRLVDRYGIRGPLAIGPAVAGTGFLLLTLPGLTAGPQEYHRQFLPPLIVLGLAMGITAPPLSAAVMNSLSVERAGLASGINSTLSRLSSVLGIALLGPMALAVFRSALAQQTQPLALDSVSRVGLTGEAWKLAAAKPPLGLPADVRAEAERAIRRTFVKTFRTLACVCAAAIWLSTVLAATVLGRRTAAQGVP